MRKLEGIILLMTVSCLVSAQTVYKEVGKDGKVIYTDEAPKDQKDKKVEKVDIDTKRNVAQPPAKDPADQSKAASEKTVKAKVDVAKAKLEKAKEALEKGKDPAEGDFQTIGGSKGQPGVRLKVEYQERVKTLEAAVKVAEEELEKAEAGVPLRAPPKTSK